MPVGAEARSYVGWRVDGFLYEWEKANGFERWLAFWLATQAMIQTFILVFVYAVLFRSPRRRYYMNDSRNAVLGSRSAGAGGGSSTKQSPIPAPAVVRPCSRCFVRRF